MATARKQPAREAKVQPAAAQSVPGTGVPAQILVLPNRLVHEDAQACLRMLTQGLRPGGQRQDVPVIADASALSTFDSSALAVLLACRREALAIGRSFVVRGLHPRLAGLAGLYGVSALLPAG